MSTKHSTNIPSALTQARRQLDRWRSRQRNKRARLPQELWRKAVVLAKEHGLNRTASALGLKYDSLRKHLDGTGGDALVPVRRMPDFVELLPGAMTPGDVAKPQVECVVEWTDGHGESVRMHIRGTGLSELSALASVFRSGRT